MSLNLELEARNIGHGEATKRRVGKRLLHCVFEVGILLKGVDGAAELIGGLLLMFLSPASIKGLIALLVEGELKEDPTDLVANLLLHNTATVIHSRASASAFLILHGATKLGLVAGLATKKLWSYPTAIAVFAGFTSYQIYQLVNQYSLFLATITVIDVMVVTLILIEYRQVRRI